ncbi:SCO family protein [Paenibacillus albicereus]|uniref:SCO family protein n=1 Tax=Paenibacillus albicereus TaxID=2726185 RepID=A0A6H2H0Y8_9BACL|nr:SCO family protein [Paenibacillus albicereus]QJC53317.1 SCO family protein [Paenibacillus albicereus]
MTFIRRHAFKIALFALCALMGAYLLVTYLQENRSSVSFPMDTPAPAYTLQSELEEGRSFSSAESDGKVRLVYFFWASCPDVCPATTFILSKAQDQLKEKGLLGTKAELQSITFDPERDTPEAIRAFAAKFHADPAGWRFLRQEDAAASEKLAKDFGLMVVKDEAGNYSHTDAIFVVDKKGNIRKYIIGSNDLKKTPDEIAASLVEAVEALD